MSSDDFNEYDDPRPAQTPEEQAKINEFITMLEPSSIQGTGIKVTKKNGAVYEGSVRFAPPVSREGEYNRIIDGILNLILEDGRLINIQLSTIDNLDYIDFRQSVKAIPGDGVALVTWENSGWGVQKGITTYHLYCGTSININDENYVLLDGFAFNEIESPFLVEGLANDEEYFFNLVATNTIGGKVNANSSSTTPKILTEPIINADTAGSTSFQWNRLDVDENLVPLIQYDLLVATTDQATIENIDILNGQHIVNPAQDTTLSLETETHYFFKLIASSAGITLAETISEETTGS